MVNFNSLQEAAQKAVLFSGNNRTVHEFVLELILVTENLLTQIIVNYAQISIFRVNQW